MSLSKKAHYYTFRSWMFTDWLIAVGGISKSMYFLGRIVSHFVAARLYYAAMIQDLFMVQKSVTFE